MWQLFGAFEKSQAPGPGFKPQPPCMGVLHANHSAAEFCPNITYILFEDVHSKQLIINKIPSVEKSFNKVYNLHYEKKEPVLILKDMSADARTLLKITKICGRILSLN